MKNKILEQTETTTLIELTKGRAVLIDTEDLPKVEKYHWHYNMRGYAVTNPGTRKEKELILMHRLINSTPLGLHTDHINRDKLDNRKSNLRSVTNAQNRYNIGVSKLNTSGYKGVSFNKQYNKWDMQIRTTTKRVCRRFTTKEEAALAYNKFAKELFGEFAYLNKVEGIL